jgi:nitroreductase
MQDEHDPLGAAVAPVTALPVVDAIVQRRTSLLVDPEAEVDAATIERLLEAATWAPNHKRTWPWRFTVLRGDARWRFGEAIAAVASSAGAPPEKVTKLRTKYGRSPVVVLVWNAVDPSPLRAREDRDAVAAAVQNLLLAATAEGLASYWASLPEDLEDAARRVAGLDPDHELVALVYLGWPTGATAAPARPAPQITWLDR